MRTTRLLASAVGLLAMLTACGGQERASPPQTQPTVTVTAAPSPTPSTPSTPSTPVLADATAIARELKKNLPSVTKVTTLTEDNDNNGLIGRPNGYVSAAVMTDKAGDTSDEDPGVSYGATVEMFDDAAGALRRSKYIQGILKDAPVFGTEYDYVAGAVLLRVNGDIKPSVAKTYQAAFEALDLT